MLRPISRIYMVALKTFTNLPIERQEEIIQVSLGEFALHEYETASLSAIISKLNIAKGSFYRYFESKQSLYFFLLDHCINLRIKNDNEYIDASVTDFFELLVQHFSAKIQYDKKFPLHSAFLYNVLQEKNNDELGNIQLISKSKALDGIKKSVAEQVKKGTFRRDIDVDAISFMVLQTHLSVFDYIALKHKADFRKNIREGKPLYSTPEEVILNVTRQFTSILKDGLLKKNKTAATRQSKWK